MCVGFWVLGAGGWIPACSDLYEIGITACHSSENKPRSGFVDQNTHFHLPWCRWQPAWLIAMKIGHVKPVVGATLVVVRSRRQPVFIPLCGLRKAMVIPSVARNLGCPVNVVGTIPATRPVLYGEDFWIPHSAALRSEYLIRVATLITWNEDRRAPVAGAEVKAAGAPESSRAPRANRG